MLRLILGFFVTALLAGPAMADDPREEYYYPPVTSQEIFARRIPGTPAADRNVRTGFITSITKSQLAAPENPRFVIFAKGQQARHMIIIALDDDVFRTLFRARAVLAQMTSNARGTPYFQKANLQFVATWFDLAKMLGFGDIVISDGVNWSHRVVLH